jgi:hypothetical protein
MRRRKLGSRTMITCQGWRLPPLPAKRALSRIRSNTSSATGSVRNSRVDPVVRITS